VILLIEDVTDRRALESKVAHQDRLASVGRLAAGVAHEIGNPLTGIACVAQNLRDDRDPELAAERVEDILEQTRRIEAIVRSLLVFSHAGVDAKGASVPSRIERISARALCEEALRLVRLDRTVREIACESRCDDAHEVLGDRRALHQVFVNLLKNAFDASSAGKHVFIDSTREGDRIRIRVRDEGSGIPDEVRARLFDPFVTTKAVGTGTGLGLSVAYGIVREHGGTISIDTAEGKGTTVDVFLPAATQHGGTA
jgi:signal transduction histidine kinase